MTSVLYLGCPTSERADAEKLLSAGQVSVVWADDLDYALDALQRRDMPVLLDLSRGAAALQLAHDLRTQRASTLMFAVVDERRPDLTTEAVLAGMADVFARPLGGRRVASAIEREQRYESRDGHGANGHGGDDLYSQSPAMRDVMAAIADAATRRAGVLIRGEEGTGRQLAARAIHARQHFSPSTFVTINCAAFETEELDAALFGAAARSQGYGDAAGSRGLARVSREGRLHEAIGGTIYLQNVADAATRVQARLARVLRDREVLLVETGEPIAFAIRPMAGADPSFDRAVQEGRVRDDLFRRLAVTRVDMPPLRERREDITLLVEHFVRRFAERTGKQIDGVDEKALLELTRYEWPGNVRELENTIERAVVLSVAPVLNSSTVWLMSATATPATAAVPSLKLHQNLEWAERETMRRALEQARGVKKDAAELMGISQRALSHYLAKYRIET
jgi:two-component system response regulator HydG